MAVSKEVKAWFEEKYGFPLSEAFEVMQPQRRVEDGPTVTPSIIERGYPFPGQAISLSHIDSENERLAEELARPLGRVAK